MLPNVWLHREPIPKLRLTVKSLTSWSDQDILALANKTFSTTDLNNSQIHNLIKLLKLEITKKPDAAYYVEEPDLAIRFNIHLKPNRLKLGCPYKSGKYIKPRHETLQEALEFSLGLLQDSKVCWEETYKAYLETTRTKTCKNMQVPLPDNTMDNKKYWGIQAGDHLEGPDHEIYLVTSVKPTLDGPPVIIYEHITLPDQSGLES